MFLSDCHFSNHSSGVSQSEGSTIFASFQSFNQISRCFFRSEEHLMTEIETDTVGLLVIDSCQFFGAQSVVFLLLFETLIGNSFNQVQH